VVAIGRNEGERLVRCFESLPAGVRHVVYVDSGSSDGSVEQARRRGFDVVELDASRPFTAARGRNAGLRRLRDRWPGLQFAQVVDGDCAFAQGWLDAAVREMESDPRLAVVCGRRRERYPHASIYNRLMDMEWDTPTGEADSSGGDALLRIASVLEVGGYDERLICGEEPEMCVRLRSRGWQIRRIDHEMTLHDAAMTRWSQWWKRAVRSGHGYAELGEMHDGMWSREKRSILFWGGLLPAAALLSAPTTFGMGLSLLLAYPVQIARVSMRRRARGDALHHAALYGTSCVLGKVPEFAGMTKYWWNRSCGTRSALIEYK
jgi:glycosyltransferase involved in cell wall biosynthesis